MPTFYGTDATALKEAKSTDPNNCKRMALDAMIYKETYIVDGTEVADDEILLGRDLPVGAVAIPILSKIDRRADPGTTFTIDIGLDAEDDIADGLALGGGTGEVSLTTREIEVTEAKQIKATVKTVSSLNAGAEIDFYFLVRQTS